MQHDIWKLDYLHVLSFLNGVFPRPSLTPLLIFDGDSEFTQYSGIKCSLKYGRAEHTEADKKYLWSFCKTKFLLMEQLGLWCTKLGILKGFKQDRP